MGCVGYGDNFRVKFHWDVSKNLFLLGLYDLIGSYPHEKGPIIQIFSDFCS